MSKNTEWKSVKINSEFTEKSKEIFRVDKDLPEGIFITNETAVNHILEKHLKGGK